MKQTRSQKHFLNSFDKKQLINILIGGLRYFLSLLTSTKPKHKKDGKKGGGVEGSLGNSGRLLFILFSFDSGEIIGLEILGRKKVMSNERTAL